MGKAVKTANHRAKIIYEAFFFCVQWAHAPMVFIGQKDGLAHDIPESIMGKFLNTFHQIETFNQCVMVKEGSAAIIAASMAFEAIKFGRLLVSPIHIGINTG